MDDDDEIRSHPSPASGSPVSPRRNGRITVTVAAAPPQQNITLALPIQQQRNGGGGGGSGSGGGGGREDCWSEGATGVLIEAWGERYLELSRGNLKQKHWKEVAEIVRSREDYTKTPKTDVQCKNRIDTVKKKYKQEKAKIVAGGGSSNWIFFERLEHLIGPTAKISASAAAAAASSPSLQIQKVPMGIPVGIRSTNQYHHPQTHQQQNQRQKAQVRRRSTVVKCDSSESDPEASPDSTDSFPPETYERKKPRIQMELNSNPRPTEPAAPAAAAVRGGDEWGNSVRELTKAIVKFGETYEEAERSKLQQVVEMEKQRMKFAKEMELQRMEFFMKTQVQISQMKHKTSGNRNHSSK